MLKVLKAQIAGIGWVSAAGSGRGRWDKAPDWPVGTPAVPTSILKSIKGGSRFGRLDLFSQIGVAAIGLALQDAGYLPPPVNQPTTGKQPAEPKPASIGLICATTSGSSLTDYDFFKSVKEAPHLASPGLFVYTLATSFLGEAALRFALTGLTMAVIEEKPNATAAVCTAIEELNCGDDEIMVVGICNLFPEKSNAPQVSGALFLVLAKENAAGSLPEDERKIILSCEPQTQTLYCNNQPCPDIFSLCKIICSS